MRLYLAWPNLCLFKGKYQGAALEDRERRWARRFSAAFGSLEEFPKTEESRDLLTLHNYPKGGWDETVSSPK